MIARSLPLFILLIVLPDVFLYLAVLRRRAGGPTKAVWWLGSVLMLAYTLVLAAQPDFIPENPWLLFVYLLLLGVFIVPKAVYALGIALGMLFGRRRQRHSPRRAQLPAPALSRQRRHWVAAIAALLVVAAVLYGVTLGNYKFETKRVDLWFKDLPSDFEGYRIALFSDAHVGSLVAKQGEKMLADAVDSLNALEADAIFFVGDLQNARPSEIGPFSEVLSRLHAPDGVYAVMGNHDYAQYVGLPEQEKEKQVLATAEEIRRLGWRLLLNENRTIRRDSAVITVAGMENLGLPPFPSKGDLAKTMTGVPDDRFTILLEHDPQSWRTEILPNSHAQLTLSGHTHGGQVSILGLSPALVIERDWEGTFVEDGRVLYVTSGLGGLIPFRIGVTGEIVLITLHHSD